MKRAEKGRGAINYNKSKPVIIDIPRWPTHDAVNARGEYLGGGAVKNNKPNTVIFKIPCKTTALITTSPIEPEQNVAKISKQPRSNKRELRMEIFAGFYMRPRGTPCLSPDGQTENVKTSRFVDLEPIQSPSIHSSVNKKLTGSSRTLFEYKQTRKHALIIKKELEASKIRKKPKR